MYIMFNMLMLLEPKTIAYLMYDSEGKLLINENGTDLYVLHFR